jgi:putative SOS response-associated peptidase YedK
MCFHNKLSKTALEIENRYKVPFKQPFDPIFHSSGFSFSLWPIITTEEPEIINQYQWGLVPFWCKGKEQALDLRKSTLNARSETSFELPSFRGSIGSKRCLVISDGFYEWKEVNKNKYPYHIGLKDNRIFSMAGIWDVWKDKSTGEEIRSFSILTCDANPLMAEIHNSKMRMPVILPQELEHDWLKGDLNKDDIKSFFKAYPEDDMVAWTISKLITSRKDNSNQPKVFERFEYGELK